MLLIHIEQNLRFSETTHLVSPFLVCLMGTNLSLLYFLISFSASSLCLAMAQDENEFIYHGFHGANLSLDGISKIHPNGLLQLTNSSKQQKGYAFYPLPLKFNSSSSSSAHSNSNSFSTIFIFDLVPELTEALSGHALTFFIAPSMDFSVAFASQYLGLFNSSNNGHSTNHIVAIEFDTTFSPEPQFGDIDDNHVGIDVNGANSTKAATASYVSNEKGENRTLKLMSGDPIQAWIDYDEAENLLNVTIAPAKSPKPTVPLLSAHIKLSEILLDTMYVGFSATTGAVTSDQYILGWSFNKSGKAQGLEFSKLPPVPKRRKASKVQTELIVITVLPVAVVVAVLLMTVAGLSYLLRRNKFEELREEWEREYGPQRFCYKNLYKATKGFTDKELLGVGGFGQVYRGTLSSSNQQIAVKRISHNSKQGMKEFVAEIVSMGRLRHKNLVQLLGYCRRKGELFLIYDYMPNGSLDKFLFRNAKPTLDWSKRFQILRGVASALLYLHEDWEQVVLHRDIKSSNVLLDANLNGRLGDFGLAKLYDHGTNPQTTQLVGTPGYLAPELTRTGKATIKTDVFAFGVFMIEVACGKRPMDHQQLYEEGNLISWVIDCWRRESILDACDPRLEGKYEMEEMELVLKLGLLCSHSNPAARPNMRQVMQYLDKDADLPDTPPQYLFCSITWADQSCSCCHSSSMLTMTNSFVSVGR